MKILILLISTLVVFIQRIPSLPICNLQTAKQAIPPRIFAEQTIDGSSQAIFLTRFLHNKAGILASELGRCYANVLDPNFLSQALTPLGLIFILYFIYQILAERKIIFAIIFAAVPLAAILNVPTAPIVIIYKLFAIIGLTFLLSKIE
ncbi:hypothetical protein HYW40_02445 [Candidatus Curtissbacteria bacterium]|nr:hypothetical protein [Candidatus Curtissbacteria bacterium]